MRAINNQQPDRAPFILGATRQSGIAAWGYHQLKQHLNLQAFSPGGGYVFAAVHNIQTGIPPDNILALFETAHGK
jgi:uroporphyrinogen decarboxylase